jgi:cytochrome c-type biogenesis protein CcmH/NrfG
MALWLAAILLASSVALFVAAPLTESPSRDEADLDEDAEKLRLEHERALATAGIRELEFDHAMNKLGDSEFQTLRRRLENRALAAMSALARLQNHPAAAHSALHCPRCAAIQPGPSNKYCVDCGVALDGPAAEN